MTLMFFGTAAKAGAEIAKVVINEVVNKDLARVKPSKELNGHEQLISKADFVEANNASKNELYSEKYVRNGKNAENAMLEARINSRDSKVENLNTNKNVAAKNLDNQKNYHSAGNGSMLFNTAKNNDIKEIDKHLNGKEFAIAAPAA